MTETLPRVAHEHHERLLQDVNRMPETGDLLMTGDAVAVRRAAHETDTFLSGTLIPHVDAAERSLYPELERMLQNRHSMAPMRREHDELRRLVADFGRLTQQLDAGSISLGKRLALRRVLFQLYALLKIHLAEEEAYLRVVDNGVSADVADLLAAALDHPGFQST
ncbi:MAG: hemerythrin domain-containing protein [Candidatus Limnocylindrales bacterium]